LKKFLLDHAEILAEEDQGKISSEVALERVKARAIEMIKLLYGDDEP